MFAFKNSAAVRRLALAGLGSVLFLASGPARAQTPAACPTTPLEVVRSRGGVIDYLGAIPNVPDLCRVVRGGEEGNYYYGVWKSDWPGAGEAYPAIKTAILGVAGTRTDFVTRSDPGMQWLDTFTNEGLETITVEGVSHTTLRLAHERNGFAGNSYHSIITNWRDVNTGVTLRTYEQQISGKSYGPDTTWQAISVQPIPKKVATGR